MLAVAPSRTPRDAVNTALPAPGADELDHSRRLQAAIHAEIARTGPIPFSRYMERCLYAPGLGYYSAGRTKFGRDGDFVTAPELGHLFAQCIAEALAPVLRTLGPDADFVELGGGSGAFAEVALLALAERDALPRSYAILEPSADLRERQQTRLRAALGADLAARVRWIDRPPEADWRGVLFANEVIDALPTTRFTLRGGEVYEEHVALDGQALRIVDRPADLLVAGAVRHVERDLGRPIEDGYRSELLPQLPYWMQAVLGSLRSGVALFVDYGYPRAEFYRPERRDGTLIAHYRHRAHADPFFLPGLQDLTAFVDFTALAEAGNSAGFGLAGYAGQARFLIANGLAGHHGRAAEGADATALYRLGQQVKRLTLPDEMGERFRAMLFARGIDPAALPPMTDIDQSGSL
ncbi:class I SAM-dependent methyltransferase [Dokdonella koreensis]|uniref:class I SAM-dependent methyltransferase n=1 Tax=Dokdonella koreensis TaxID=323415 RepID=UPI000AAB0307|nr:SAM-dependent methyltransferase [Dokdonella koreensis]